jgi:hypothetical protein
MPQDDLNSAAMQSPILCFTFLFAALILYIYMIIYIKHIKATYYDCKKSPFIWIFILSLQQYQRCFI